ncbi:MAG: hypothetical protein NVV62_02910 [Terricaulis sp.]|nr:hypothetical protein [Terricaulis sp.]
MVANLRQALACAAACVLSACASAGGGAETSYPQSVAGRDMRFDVLEPRPLEPGRCGLYVWAQSAQQPLFIAVAYNTPAQVHVRIDGRDRVLARTSFDGAPNSGHFEVQTFEDRNMALTLDVTFDLDRPLRDGASIRTGVMRVRDREGWETIVPIGGLLACAS